MADFRTLKRSMSEDVVPSPSKRFFRSFSKRESGPSPLRNGHPHHVRQQARSLPIFPARQALIAEIRSSATVIIVGETGSGKTTQIPQYLNEGRLAKLGIIACTQPRRVAAISIANRVAKEMGVQIGQEVGFTVRFEDVTSDKTKIKYMTDGMLLREAVQDPLVRRYSVVILDEAHERTVHTDVLFGVVKTAQELRREKKLKPLKIVVMSATLDAEHFAAYFGHAKVLYIEGRQYPVDIMYTLEVHTDYLHAAFVTAMQLHREKPPGGDILVFLTGQDEIESLAKMLSDCAEHCPPGTPQLMVCQLFAALPSKLQMEAFQPSPLDTRKIILATNIAETSVTIPGVKYVIDPGFVKARGIHARSGLDLLSVQPISKAQARQRSGRAGREFNGVCYRLYTEQQFDGLSEATQPEIQRCSLSSVVLQLLALGISDVASFEFMDRPSPAAISNALEELEMLCAVDQRHKLTSLGQQMARFPLEPRLAKILIRSGELNCCEEMLTVVALMSVDSITFTPHSKRDQAIAIRRKFVSSEGDQLTLLNIYRAYKAVGGSNDWCHEHFINSRTMKLVMDIRKQLRGLCLKLDIPLQSCNKDLVKVRQCLAAGFFLNVAERQLDGTYRTVAHNETVSIHPTSCLFLARPTHVMYGELVHTSKCYMSKVCVVEPLWLFDAAPNFFRQHRLQNVLRAVAS